MQPQRSALNAEVRDLPLATFTDQARNSDPLGLNCRPGGKTCSASTARVDNRVTLDGEHVGDDPEIMGGSDGSRSDQNTDECRDGNHSRSGHRSNGSSSHDEHSVRQTFYRVERGATANVSVAHFEW